MNTPRYDEVQVGDALPALELSPISRTTLALFAGASGDHNPIHIDTDFARKAGMPDVFAHGMLGMAWLGRLLSRGPLPALLELGYRLFLRLRPLWRRRPAEAVATAPVCDAPSPPALGHRRPPPGQRPEARRSADHV